MEDKIKVGEYVRIKKGYIRQVIGRDVDDHILLDVGYDGSNYLTLIEEKEDIVKYSKNIIDLIEVGDYVNDHKIIMDLEKSKKYYKSEYDFVTAVGYTFSNEDIKSIVTKEQFKKMEYEV